jgi:hypothetical protein
VCVYVCVCVCVRVLCGRVCCACFFECACVRCVHVRAWRSPLSAGFRSSACFRSSTLNARPGWGAITDNEGPTGALSLNEKSGGMRGRLTGASFCGFSRRSGSAVSSGIHAACASGAPPGGCRWAAAQKSRWSGRISTMALASDVCIIVAYDRLCVSGQTYQNVRCVPQRHLLP